MNQDQTKQGYITRVIFDANSMPENFATGFNAKAAGLDIDEMRKNPKIMILEEGKIATTRFDVPIGAAKALGLEDNVTLHVRYKRNKDNPILSFSLQTNEGQSNVKMQIKDMSIKKFAEVKLSNAHPAAFVGGHFEGDSMTANNMFYLKLARDIDRHFTEFVDAHIAKLIASQIDPPAPQAPKVDEPIFH